jgi:hypothetical protein
MYEDRIGGKDKDKCGLLIVNLSTELNAFLESGDQLLSNSKSCLGNTFQFEQFTF